MLGFWIHQNKIKVCSSFPKSFFRRENERESECVSERERRKKLVGRIE